MSEFNQCTECRTILIDAYAAMDPPIEVNVSTTPPAFWNAHFPTTISTCPHGVTFYSEPTHEQRLRWVETRTP